MREQLERQIHDNPDDDAPRLIYADWLEENGKPDRAEFIRVQIALAIETLSPDERKGLTAREKQLLLQHHTEWLGELAPFLVNAKDMIGYFAREPKCQFRRGFLEVLDIGTLGYQFAEAMANASELLWVQDFAFSDLAQHWDYRHYAESSPFATLKLEDIPENVDVAASLLRCPYLKNVRRLRIGEDQEGEYEGGACFSFVRRAVDLVRKMPRLEELHLLCKGYDHRELFTLETCSNLRVLRMYHVTTETDEIDEDEGPYRLELLANNPAFRNLTTLKFHPHSAEMMYVDDLGEGEAIDDFLWSYLPLEKVEALVNSSHLPNLRHLQLRLSDMGDDGCRVIVDSRILQRLRILDLQYGAITDEGAKMLAACPDLKRLERLDIRSNGLTEIGIAALESTGIHVLADNQQTPEELANREYLYEGDNE